MEVTKNYTIEWQDPSSEWLSLEPNLTGTLFSYEDDWGEEQIGIDEIFWNVKDFTEEENKIISEYVYRHHSELEAFLLKDYKIDKS